MIGFLGAMSPPILISLPPSEAAVTSLETGRRLPLFLPYVVQKLHITELFLMQYFAQSENIQLFQYVYV
jgi:hypothetical protein